MNDEQVVPLGPWVKKGACRGLPERAKADFFPPRGDSAGAYARARKICAVCPVMEECREYGLQFSQHDLIGMWGGLSTEERGQERSRRRKLARLGVPA